MIVIADTSVLLNLCRIGEIQLLQSLYQNVVAPVSVRDEFERAVGVYGKFSGMVFPDFIHTATPATALKQWAPWASLDRGESDAISLAIEMKADLLLVDERKGRLVAARLNVTFSGLVGVLVQARRRGLLEDLSLTLGRLRAEAGFYLSERHVAEALQATREAL